jgi:hypothetical protein
MQGASALLYPNDGRLKREQRAVRRGAALRAAGRRLVLQHSLSVAHSAELSCGPTETWARNGRLAGEWRGQFVNDEHERCPSSPQGLEVSKNGTDAARLEGS